MTIIGLFISLTSICLMGYLALIGVMNEQNLTWRDLFRMMKKFGKTVDTTTKEDAE